MIRKPTDGWGRESAAVATVRGATTTGAAVVRTGGQMVRGVFMCVFGGLWLFGALRGMIGGSVPTLVGCGVIGGLVMVSGLRLLSGARDKAPAAAAMAPAYAGGAASRIDYSRGKLASYCLFGAIALVGAGFAAARFDGRAQFFGMILVPVFGLMVVAAARKLCSDSLALSWNGQGLTIAGLWSRRTASWAEVKSIGLQQVSTYAYGVVKVATNRSLMVKFTSGGLFGGKIGISSTLLDLEGQTLDALLLRLQAAQLGRASAPAQARPAQASQAPARPAPQAQPRPAPPLQAAPARGEFDPDAAIARYKAEQARAQAAPAYAPPAAAYAPGPARAAFGRRGVG